MLRVLGQELVAAGADPWAENCFTETASQADAFRCIGQSFAERAGQLLWYFEYPTPWKTVAVSLTEALRCKMLRMQLTGSASTALQL